jgi:ABC-type transporter MlaC component
VVDIMVEGASLVLARRSEFNSVMPANGGHVVSLLTKLRENTQTLALRQNTTSVRTQ